MFLDYIVSGANKQITFGAVKSSGVAISFLSFILPPSLVIIMSSTAQSIISRGGPSAETVEPIPVPSHYRGVYSVGHSIVAQLVTFVYLSSAPRNQHC